MKTIFKSNWIIFLIILSAGVSCSPDKNTEDQKDITGFYNGNLPCANCKTLRFNLVVFENNTYESSTLKDGEYSQIERSQGTWKMNKERLVLTSAKGKQKTIYDINQKVLVSSTVNGAARTGKDLEANSIVKINAIKNTQNVV